MAKLKYSFKHDILFKMYFVRHQDQLMRLVALILQIPLGSITEFQIINTEMPPEAVSTKFCRLDINMKVNGRLDLEVQVSDEGDFAKRAAYYGAREFSLGLPSGGAYSEIPPVIVISIIDFVLWKADKVHTIFHIWEDDEHELMIAELEWHYFELPKLGEEIDVNDELDIWLKIFDADTEEDIEKLLELEVPIVQQAISAYRELTGDREFLRLVRMREDAAHNEASALRHARQEGYRDADKKWQGVVEEQATLIAELQAKLTEKE